MSNAAARSLLLAAQGLQSPPSAPASKEACLTAIRRMGLLQIDTISVIARSPYLVLWSRLGDYRPEWLDELLAEGALFEYWAHAACFLPIEEYRIYRHRMLEYARDHGCRPSDLTGANTGESEVRDRVLKRIREEGAARSVDFKGEGRGGGTWWNRKPEKIALEHLFNAGELMIARRDRFQRVYDLRKRVLPDWDDANALPREEERRILILKSVRALGVARSGWLSGFGGYWSHLSVRDTQAVLKAALSDGELISVTVEGWSEPAYIHRESLDLAERAAGGEIDSTVTTLLSPFDPVVSNRSRGRDLFGFDYKIEVYTPEARRRYGYFSLPILHRGALVGRLDAKAHRRDGLFEVKSLHLEEELPAPDTLAQELATTLTAFARWHGTPEILLRPTNPAHFGDALRAALAS